MLDFNLIGVAVSKDAARYTLFLVEKIASAPSAKYFSLLDTLHRQWQPELFQGTLPEAAVITSSLDEIGWRKTSIEEPKDIERALRWGVVNSAYNLTKVGAQEGVLTRQELLEKIK